MAFGREAPASSREATDVGYPGAASSSGCLPVVRAQGLASVAWWPRQADLWRILWYRVDVVFVRSSVMRIFFRSLALGKEGCEEIQESVDLRLCHDQGWDHAQHMLIRGIQ